MKEYIISIALAAGCLGMTMTAQTASQPVHDNATFSKGNVVTHQYDAASLIKIEVNDAAFRGVSANGDELFRIGAEAIDAIHFNRPIALAGLDMRTETNPNYPGYLHAQVQLTKGAELSLEGIEIACVPTYFFTVADGKAVYKGEDGTFDLWYNDSQKALYLENRALKYPDAVWIGGNGWAHENSTSVTNMFAYYGESWTAPEVGLMAVKTGDNLYEVSMYLGGENVALKFFGQRGWGQEFTSIYEKPYPAGMLEPAYVNDNQTGYGHFTGDFTVGSDFHPGVYTLCLDLNRHVCWFKGLENESEISTVCKINDIELVDKEYTSVHDGGTITNQYKQFNTPQIMTQGQEVTFTGFRGDLSKMLHPDYFEIRDGKTYFTAPTGYYQIYYKKDRNIFYVICEDNDIEKVTVCGNGIGHPCQSFASHDVSGFSWDDPVNYFTAIDKGNGVLEGTFFIEPNSAWTQEGSFFQIYEWRRPDWVCMYNAADASHVTIENENGAKIGSYKQSQNFGFSSPEDIAPGIYQISIDTKAEGYVKGQKAIIKFKKISPEN